MDVDFVVTGFEQYSNFASGIYRDYKSDLFGLMNLFGVNSEVPFIILLVFISLLIILIFRKRYSPAK